MGWQYRINLFLYQVWCLLLDVVYSFVAAPVVFYPMTMGYVAGIAKSFDGSLYPITVFLFINLAVVGVAIKAMLLARYYAVLPNNHFLKAHNEMFVILILGWYILYVGSLATTALLIYPNILNNKPEFEKQFTCAAAVVIYAKDAFQHTSFIPLLYNAGVLVVLTITIGGSIIYLTFSAIKTSTHLSERTKNLQKKFLIHVALQGAIPAVFLGVPLVTLFCIFVFSIVNTQSE
ncbi:hypothetical protein Y032_0593g405 [Ancylostoma ceylanicum]|nr:hypothetical protein Y032_0593g405 [Ancylostoma ceylanicum]